MKKTLLIMSALAGMPSLAHAQCAPTAPPNTPQPAPVRRAQDLLNAFGMNTHVEYGSTNTSGYYDAKYPSSPTATDGVVTMLNYIGVANVRDGSGDLATGMFGPNNTEGFGTAPDGRWELYSDLLSARPTNASVTPKFMMSMNTSLAYNGGSPSIPDYNLLLQDKSNFEYLISPSNPKMFPGQLLAIEGLNEPDIENDNVLGGVDYTYNYINQSGQAMGGNTPGTTDDGPASVAQHQIDQYAIMKADPALAGIPDWEFSLNSPPYFAGQYETLYGATGGNNGNPPVVGDVLTSFDVLDNGVYTQVITPEFYDWPSSFMSHDYTYAPPNSCTPVAGPYAAQLNSLQYVAKETGLQAGIINYGGATAQPPGIPVNYQAAYKNGIYDYTTQAKLILSIYFDSFYEGAQRVFGYELADLQTDTALAVDGYHWGLFDATQKAKPAAAVVSNWTTLFTDKASNATTFAPGNMTVMTSGIPVTINSTTNGYTLISEKASGLYLIATWYEPNIWDVSTNWKATPVAPIPVTVTPSLTCKSSSVYDPYNGSTLTSSIQSNVISFMLPDHMVFVECQT